MGRVIRYGTEPPPIEARIDWAHPMAQDLRCLGSGGVFWLHDDSQVQVGNTGQHVHIANVLAPTPVFAHRQAGTIAAMVRYTPTASFDPRIGDGWVPDNGYLALHRENEAMPARVYAGHAHEAHIAGWTTNRFGPSTARPAQTHPSFVGVTHSNSVASEHLQLWGAGGLRVQTMNQFSAPTGTPTSLNICESSATLWQEIFALHYYNRALTGHEMAWIHDEPYSMLMYEKPVYYSLPSVGVPLAVFSHHYRINVGTRE